MYEPSTEVSTSSCGTGPYVPSVSLCHFVYRVVNVLCSALCAGLNYWCLALGALQMVLVRCSSTLQEQVTM